MINWNEDSSVEFKSIAKISILNELNSVESTIKIWLINSQNAKRKENIFICMQFKFFLNYLSALSSKYYFLNYRIFRVVSIFWAYWNDVFECIKKNVIDITKKTSSRKILESKIEFDELIYWWLWCLMTQYWNWFNCYCYCNWNDQICVNKCLFRIIFLSLMI